MELHYFVTFLSLGTLQGSVFTHVRRLTDMSGSYAGIITYRRIYDLFSAVMMYQACIPRIYVDVTSVVLVVVVVVLVVVVVTVKYVDKRCTGKSSSVFLLHQFTDKENKKPQTVLVIVLLFITSQNVERLSTFLPLDSAVKSNGVIMPGVCMEEILRKSLFTLPVTRFQPKDTSFLMIIEQWTFQLHWMCEVS